MSESYPIEATGATLEEAIEKGLTELGLSRSEVIIEIVQEGGKSMLGLGVKEAIVRLTPLRTPRPQAPPVPPSRSPAPAAPRPARSTVSSGQNDLPDDAAIGVATVEEILDYMQINASINVQQAEPTDSEEVAPWILNIEGHDLGTLIGRRGETLDALQYITRLIVSREVQHRANIVLDVEGYKSRREATLRRLAVRMAEQARSLGRTVSLEPMPPNERRIIHITLREDNSVVTESVGTGDRRKVTIIPVNSSP